jgi:hypothetical protein
MLESPIFAPDLTPDSRPVRLKAVKREEGRRNLHSVAVADTHSPCPLLKLRRRCSRSLCASAATSSGGLKLRWIESSSPDAVRLSCSLEPWWLSAIKPLGVVPGDESASPEMEAAELRNPVAGSLETVRALVPPREAGWTTKSCGADTEDCIEAWANANEGIELCGTRDGFREPAGVPGRDGVGVACLEGRPGTDDMTIIKTVGK